MDLLTAVILGMIEGFTEFLPVSSTGHLILANEYFSFSPELNRTFDVFIQLGAIASVMIVYRKKLLPAREMPLKDYRHFMAMLALSSLPVLIAGFLLHRYITVYLFTPFSVSISLIFWGVVLILTDKHRCRVRIVSLYGMDTGTALSIGITQCLALIPGTSRSAVTIIGSLLLGVSGTIAVEYSFFLAIPSLSAAALFSLLNADVELSTKNCLILGTGAVSAFATAWLVIRSLIGFVSRYGFRSMGYYRVILGCAVLSYLFLRDFTAR